MINPFLYALGFIIYMIFNILTFDFYSKKKGVTNIWVLFFIFLYYSLLIMYIINFIDPDSELYVKLIQMVIYIIPGGIYMYNYYVKLLRNNNETSKYYSD